LKARVQIVYKFRRIFSGAYRNFEEYQKDFEPSIIIIIIIIIINTHLLTHSMVQSPSSEANWFAASQEIPRISRNPKVHYRTHKRPPTVSIIIIINYYYYY